VRLTGAVVELLVIAEVERMSRLPFLRFTTSLALKGMAAW
jgi:hypothetical protein